MKQVLSIQLIFSFAVLGLLNILLGSSALAADAPLTSPEQKPLKLIFGYNPSENSEAAVVNAQKFSAYFKEKLGVDFQTYVSSDYTGLIEALRAKRLDFAWIPPFSFVKAEKIADAVPLMKSVYKGSATVYSAIIVRKDRGFKTIQDLKGKNIAWVDPSSASGHVFPKSTLMRRYQIDPDKFFRRQIFAGGHDAVVLSVINGKVDAGATYMANEKGEEGSWRHFLSSPADQEKIQILMVSDPITSDLIVTRKEFQNKYPGLVANMVRVLEQMGTDPVGGPMLRELYKVDRLIPAKSEDYDNVREAAKLLKLN